MEAGCALYMNERFHYRLALARASYGLEMRVIAVVRGVETCLASQAWSQPHATIEVVVQEHDIRFRVGTDDDRLVAFGSSVDGRALSPDVAGGHTGVVIGLYALASDVREPVGDSPRAYADFRSLTIKPR
jgi:alpha-N-arabinofuranosidase